MTLTNRITSEQLTNLRITLQPLIGYQFHMLTLPTVILHAFKPSQIGSIVGDLMDALIPHLSDIPSSNIPSVGLTKHEGILGEREGYPDYRHISGLRLELKLLYVENPQLNMKKPPTPREPSARLSRKVTMNNIVPQTDVLLVIAYQLQLHQDNFDLVSPTIIDLGIFSMIEIIEARDNRMMTGGGRWSSNLQTPTVLNKQGRHKKVQNLSLQEEDYNEDTNFGKLNRIPHQNLQGFLKKYVIKRTKSPTSGKVATELQGGT